MTCFPHRTGNDCLPHEFSIQFMFWIPPCSIIPCKPDSFEDTNSFVKCLAHVDPYSTNSHHTIPLPQWLFLHEWILSHRIWESRVQNNPERSCLRMSLLLHPLLLLFVQCIYWTNLWFLVLLFLRTYDFASRWLSHLVHLFSWSHYILLFTVLRSFVHVLPSLPSLFTLFLYFHDPKNQRIILPNFLDHSFVPSLLTIFQLNGKIR